MKIEVEIKSIDGPLDRIKTVFSVDPEGVDSETLKSEVSRVIQDHYDFATGVEPARTLAERDN